MQINLVLALIIFSFLLIIITIEILRKGRMPEKYSLLWFFIAIIIFLVAIIPDALGFIANAIGFEVLSNMVIAIILVLLTFLTLALTVIIAGQKKKTTLLIQEVSLLKAEIKKNERKK